MLIAHSVNGLATVSLFHQLFVNQLAAANHTHTQPSRLYVICIFRPFVLKPRSLDEGRMINELWTYPVMEDTTLRWEGWPFSHFSFQSDTSLLFIIANKDLGTQWKNFWSLHTEGWYFFLAFSHPFRQKLKAVYYSRPQTFQKSISGARLHDNLNSTSQRPSPAQILNTVAL